jgi:hypothetical protein
VLAWNSLFVMAVSSIVAENAIEMIVIELRARSRQQVTPTSGWDHGEVRLRRQSTHKQEHGEAKRT